ncbi:FCD domain-containing protein [Rhodobacter sphaeroides]|jgi:GntR family transcriptional repressor for pyruvate dehydrogenase complex|uniref:Transcriptional regulator, GntR family n=2 Tax=Cereibacter sphaeroides TaxID=1063 RepID=Q3IWS5_CERS4|nr:FadR/GntR family transcriptional regulator [Cereibacter sphaeroides]ABN78150.1 transcriptional regulator, GntR family [Cereibacter sphaeroides ATCC 17029]EKX58690.1 Transcriptional regulator, GntR family [Rhodobacter sp. AKP1]ABA81009.1 transcriptional regulator, GntR family [Cereibacter sphaeroides 2.4.1]AMJ49326.1 GntR family transcriptional regulator [Cereibacter sphaeroides]ANS36034.1 GntR family transcriptional regulator [Cereibacter sphaeroides]
MAHLKQSTRMPLADKVYHTLYTRISNGDYPPNQKLPPEMQLAEELGVSRPVLRAALERLRDEGIVHSRQGAGNYVRPIQIAPLGFARVETLADIQRCYEFRITIETDATWLAAQRRNPAILAEIEAALEQLRAATGSMQHREDADFAFHVGIARGANNQYYEATLRALRNHINVGMKLHGDALMTDGQKGLEGVLREHAGIFEAVRDGRADEARDQMRAHLEHSRDRLFGGSLLDLRMR